MNALGMTFFAVLFVAGACLFLPAANAMERARYSKTKARQPLVDDEAFLYAIRAVESGGNPRAVGKHGELSAYQFTASTWHLHTEAPHVWGQSPGFADKIARTHLAWLQERLVKREISPTVANLAAAWHHGPNFSSAALVSSDYSERVVNLYAEQQKAAR